MAVSGEAFAASALSGSGWNEPGELAPLLAGDERTGFEPRRGQLLAQNDADDSYDPFADYSEFEQSSDEEEDINFFRNGRLFTLGFIGGYRGWTGESEQHLRRRTFVRPVSLVLF